MIWEVLFAWLHLLAVGLTAGLLLTVHWLLRRPIDRAQARLLGIVDLGYYLAAMGSLATGLARVLNFGNGTAYYAANALFWTKMGVFMALVLVSVLPSLQFVRWNREARSAPVFAPLAREIERVRACVALELVLVAFLPLLATLLQRGYGL